MTRMIYDLVLLASALTFMACGQGQEGEPRGGAMPSNGISTNADASPEDDFDDSSDRRPDDEDDDDDGDTASGFACPKYPIVLHHGFMAGAKMGGFVGAKAFFEKHKCKAFETEVAAVQTAAYRGAQLKKSIEKILESTGAEKVHIVAHSQGGLDARYAISALGLGERVASLSTLGTPHGGTPLADLALKTSGPMAKKALSAMLDMMGRSINGSTPEPDTMAAVESLSEAYMKTFNSEVRDDPNVLYQSWSAKSGSGSGDQMKTLMMLSHGILSLAAGANDGVVPERSAHWGKFRGALTADHLDLIGYRLLDFSSPFDHLKFLRKLASELADKGL